MERLFYRKDPEARAGLREEIGSLLARVKFNRKSRLSQDLAERWTPEELELVRLWAERVKAGEVSSYAASRHASKELKGVRSFEAVRKKIKNWVNYGVFA
jgi:hypothetical protein